MIIFIYTFILYFRLNMDDQLDMREHVFDVEDGVAKVLVNNASYVGKRLSTDSRVPGRIGRPEFYDFCEKELKASDYVLNTIKHGYQIPFKSTPPSSFCKNNQSFLKKKDFGYQELLRLETLGCIRRVKQKPYLCLPLSIVFSNKWRLVVDASRHLNPYIIDRKIKLEDLDVGEKMLKQGDFMTTSDLDSGYWHIPLHEEYKKFVGLHYECDNGEIIYWEYNVLFLGLKDAVWIFTKMLIPHKQYLRSFGIRCQIFIDDQRVMSSSFEKNKAEDKFAQETFSKAGWLVNHKKSSGEPKQSLKFLGLVNNTEEMRYYVPDDKCEDICKLISEILSAKRRRVHIKVLAKLLGI